MRSLVGLIICAVAFAGTAACVPTPEVAHNPVSLSPPYSDLPAPPPGTAIEAGTKVTLDAREQEAVVTAVTKWMKDPGSVQFGPMGGARNSHGLVTVCGEVRGRNGTGNYAAMAPYVGVLMGTRTSPAFVVVGIASSDRERSEVASLCRDSGVAAKG